MRIFIKRILVIVLLVLLTNIGYTEDILGITGFEYVSFDSVLSDLSYYFERPICMAYIKLKDGEKKPKFDLINKDPNKIMPLLLENMPQYTYVITKNYINILPKKEINSSKYYLNQRISNFVVKNKNIEYAFHKLQDLIKKEHSELVVIYSRGCLGRRVVTGYSGTITDSKEIKERLKRHGRDDIVWEERLLNINMKNCTIREILNEMITQDNRYEWNFTNHSIIMGTYQLFYLTHPNYKRNNAK